MTIIRRVALSAMVIAGLAPAMVSVAEAAPISVPFQINPAPFGNPNGSFDVPAIHCVAVIGGRAGTAVISGGDRAGWGCPPSSTASWLNLSTGASGSQRLSNGLYDHPPTAELRTGSGQVAVTVTVAAGVVTPGFATFRVP